MKPISKKMFIALAIIIGPFALFLIGDFVYRQAYVLVWNYKTDRFMDSLERPYREDTYGGKTPEETWAMFFDAVKKGDIDLAVKYCAVDRQQRCMETLDFHKDKKDYESWIKELETLSKDSKPASGNEIVVNDSNRADFSYKYYDEEFKKYLWSPVVFNLNTYTKVWKITVI